jgi:hypothetical protein
MTTATIASTQTVMLFPEDLKGLAAFYEHVLCFPVLEDQREEGWIVFDGGNIEIAMHHPVGTGTGGQPKLIFKSDDLDAMLGYLKSKNVLVGTIHPFSRGRFFDASGPDGHEFRFVETKT